MIQVRGDRVLVALPPAPENFVTEAGIVCVRDPDKFLTPTRGIVVQLGQKPNTCDLHDVRNEVHTWFVEQARNGYVLGISQAGDALDRLLMTMQPAGFEVQVGDCVLFSMGAGQLVTFEGVEYVILAEAEILGVVEPMQKDEAAA